MDAPNSGSLDWTLGEVGPPWHQGTHLTERYGVYQKHIIGMLLGFDGYMRWFFEEVYERHL